MNRELDEKLCADFPKLFGNRSKSEMETCFAWGFECGDGWEPIIRELASKLEAINGLLAEEDWIRASQVKEKFGTLRFYIDGISSAISEYVYNLIDKTEILSMQTCEQCGKRGKLRGTSWLYTACKKHTKEGDL